MMFLSMTIKSLLSSPALHRPVKVVRLISRDTAEEIVLQRAQAKLSLTQTVIEEGQFSHGTVGMVANNNNELSDILKFGLEMILQSEEGWGCV